MDPMIIENFLSPTVQEEIERTLMGFEFPWHYYANTNAADATTKSGDVPQFVHGFIQDGRVLSHFASLPQRIVAGLGLPPEAILRAKANLLARDREPLVHPRHVDEPTPHLVMVYYVNDADGYTCLYKAAEISHRINPKRGRAVVFNGATYHASSSPVEARFRCVVNLNLRHDVAPGVFARFQV